MVDELTKTKSMSLYTNSELTYTLDTKDFILDLSTRASQVVATF